ncbi:MFS transporter [Ponticoccus litoralis]|uniref:MFS transporter n=1 Tax=Ponticoccus litoralis TaxID=422297 RepID=A0AAW9SLR0_9RHOB
MCCGRRSFRWTRSGWSRCWCFHWALKFLWAPRIERFRLPDGGRDRSALIVLSGVTVVITALLAVGLVGPFPVLPVLAILMVAAFATATVDIACDGYAVAALRNTRYGWGNAAQVGGAYLGSAIGGGVFLILVDRVGWLGASWAMALVIAVLCLPFTRIARSPMALPRAHTPSLKAALRRPEVRKGLLIAALYVVAQKTAIGMFGPFFIDAGYDLASLGILSGVGSLTLGFLGAMLGGGFVRRFGAQSVLVGAVALQSAILAIVALSAGDTILPAALWRRRRWWPVLPSWPLASSPSTGSSWSGPTRVRAVSTSRFSNAWMPGSRCFREPPRVCWPNISATGSSSVSPARSRLRRCR